MKKTNLVSLSFFFSFITLCAQNPKADSLINELNKTKIPSDMELSIYKELSYIYSENEVDKSSLYARKGLQIAEKMDNKSYISIFNDQIGVNYYTKSQYDSAFIYLDKALEWAIIAGDKAQEAVVYNDLGNAYRRKTEYDNALEKYLSALALYESINDKDGCAISLINISGMHETLRNYERALFYLKQAEEISKTIDNKSVQMHVAYRQGRLYRREGKFAEAIEYAFKANKISQDLFDKKYEIATLTLIVTSYSNLGDTDKAKKHSEQCLQLAENYGDKRLLMGVLGEFSDTYFIQHQYQECADMAYKAWSMDSTDLVYATDAALTLSLANIFLGNKDKAAHYLNNFATMIVQRNDKNSQSTLLEMEVKYETEKKEMHIAALEKDKKLYSVLGIAVALVLLSIIGLLYYRHRLSTQKRKLAEQQIKQLEQEKELVAIRSALDAEKAEREIIARDLHDGVGAMLSVVKNNMNIMKSYSVIENKEIDYFNKALDGIDKSIVELRRVAHHIMPAILMEKGLDAALDDFCRSIPEAVFHSSKPAHRFDPEKELVLYRCAYELVNNALKHARALHIEVHFTMDKDTAYLSVVDDGCGFEPQTVKHGMGIKNMHNRLTAFGGKIEIFSEPGKGTEANVELKV